MLSVSVRTMSSIRTVERRPLNRKVASFFAGIGGLELGLERAGFSVTFQCEVNPFCLSILDQHWPGIPRKADIAEVVNADIPYSDVWTAGFPCQDLSLARMGPRAGLGGAKSGLFHEFMRLVQRGLPRTVIIENVHGLLTSHGGRDFTIVLKALDELGYGVAWRVFDSKYFGIPQQRRRVFVVGMHRDARSAAEVLFEPQCSNGNAPPSRGDGKKSASLFQTVVGDPVKGPLTKALAHCIYAESARHTGTDWSRNYVWYPEGRVRRFTSNEVERAQGFPVDWTLPSGQIKWPLDRIESKRYHAIGNSVTPQVAEWVARRLAVVLDRKDQAMLRDSVLGKKLVAAE